MPGLPAFAVSCSKLQRDGYDITLLRQFLTLRYFFPPALAWFPKQACGVENNGNDFVPEAEFWAAQRGQPVSHPGNPGDHLRECGSSNQTTWQRGRIGLGIPFSLNSLSPPHSPQSPSSVTPHRLPALNPISNNLPFNLPSNGCS